MGRNGFAALVITGVILAIVWITAQVQSRWMDNEVNHEAPR